MVACTLPQLIAACHVLLRLHAPRHPPCALSSLTIKFAQRGLLHQTDWCIQIDQSLIDKSLIDQSLMPQVLISEAFRSANYAQLYLRFLSEYWFLGKEFFRLPIQFSKTFKLPLGFIVGIAISENRPKLLNTLFRYFFSRSYRFLQDQWRWGGSNPWPQACKARALPNWATPPQFVRFSCTRRLRIRNQEFGLLHL